MFFVIIVVVVVFVISQLLISLRVAGVILRHNLFNYSKFIGGT